MKLDTKTLDEFKAVALCCACGRPMSETKRVNFVFLGKKATWKFPVVIELMTGTLEGALSVVCTECTMEDFTAKANGDKFSQIEIHYAIEFRNGECFYHPIDDLENLV
jgi:hypothetical protein